jgi:hypothetical protein
MIARCGRPGRQLRSHKVASMLVAFIMSSCAAPCRAENKTGISPDYWRCYMFRHMTTLINPSADVPTAGLSIQRCKSVVKGLVARGGQASGEGDLERVQR